MKRWWLVWAAAGVAVWNLTIGTIESSGLYPVHVLYLSLGAFVGSYNPAPGQPEAPTTFMVIGLTGALAIAFATAATAVMALTREQLSRMRALRHHSEVVVLGRSAEARVIVQSARQAGLRVLHIAEDGDLRMTTWPMLTQNSQIVRAIRRASYVIVAGSQEGENAVAAQQLLDIDLPAGLRPGILIRSELMTEALRPPVLRGDLPPLEAFSPRDNVAQRVVEAVHETTVARRTSLRVRVISADRVSQEWLTNAARAQQILGSSPRFELVDIGPFDLTVAFGGEAIGAAMKSIGPLIAVAERALFESIPWLRERLDGTITVIDPLDAGVGFDVVANGISRQLGRGFHQAHSMLHRQMPAWASIRNGRDEQTSVLAAQAMLRILDQFGLELARVGEPAILSEHQELVIARAEHEDWLHNRKWRDEEGNLWPAWRRADGSVSEGAVPWDELSKAERDYLIDLPRKVYPALAAMFGYVIRERNAGESPGRL